MLHISALKLHERAFQFEDERLEQATLLPFFDRAGAVRQLLLIDLTLRTARVMGFEPGLVRLPLFQQLATIRVPIASLPYLSPETAGPLGELWHFDPWWLLDLSPFDTQQTTPLLKTTNCVDLLLVDNPTLRFRRDLSRVTWLFQGDSEHRTGKRWKPALLPEHHPEPPSETSRPARRTWVLDPMWNRG